MFKSHPKKAFLGLIVASLPGAAAADRGEGFASVGAVGNLSFFRCPFLTYSDRRPRLNAATFAVESTLGLGLTDWLEVGFRGRAFLPARITDQEVSIQGFPAGNAVYEVLALQAPIAVTARYSRGGSTALALTLETGIEWSHWSLRSFSKGTLTGGSFDVDSLDDWSTSFVLGLEAAFEWRHFDHFSFKLGPRLTATTSGAMHMGIVLGGTFFWGVGVF